MAVQTVKPGAKRSPSCLIAVCALLVLGAAGIALWESDWMLERQTSQASREQLQNMAEQMPGSAIVQYHFARRLAADGQEDQAISALIHAHEIDPNSPRIVALLGDQLTRQARFREAGGLLQNFTSQHPHDPQTQYALGVYYYRVYEQAQAVSALQKAVKLDPSDVRAWRVLGEAEMALGHYGEAVSAYDAALAHEPNHADTLARRGTAHQMLNDLPAAETDLRTACRLSPTNVTARYLLGELLAHYRPAPEAQREAETILRSLSAEPNPIPEVHRELGRVYSAQQRWPEAQTELLMYVAKKPNDATGLYLYARVLRLAGKSDKAIMRRYLKVQAEEETRKNLLLKVQADPNNLAARLAQAHYLAAHGETAFAILTYERILRQDPQNQEAQQALSRLRGEGQQKGQQSGSHQ